jgi:hypothetical protein
MKREMINAKIEERRKRADALTSLNQVLSEKYAEAGFSNPLLKGEILSKAVASAYGQRVRVIADDFYTTVENVKEALKDLSFNSISNKEENIPF